ncbi:MAG: O-antigen ligase family protein [Caldilineaceae bacterium]|nr:O-antigen ligase family protein [Caldilineaceae bacterium]
MTEMVEGAGKTVHRRRRKRPHSTAVLSFAATSVLGFSSALAASSALIFFTTALLGVAISYDKLAALGRMQLITVGLMIAWSIGYLNQATSEDGTVGITSVIAAWLAFLLGVVYLLTADWQAWGVAKPEILQSPAAILLTWLPNQDDGVVINGNVAASGLVPLIGLGIGGSAWLWRRNRIASIATFITLAFAGLAMQTTNSQGAYLGLGAGCAVGAYLYKRTGVWQEKHWRFVTDGLLILLFTALIVGFLWAMIRPDAAGPLGKGAADNSALNRAQLWHDVLPLILDYRFTGSGLADSMPILSAYLFLLHVGFLSHAHNLYLQIALTQGLPGLITFLGMTIAALISLITILGYGSKDQRLLAAGTLIALIGILVHGLVDAALYVSVLVPLLFLPLGAAGALRCTPYQAHSRRQSRSTRIQAASGTLAPLALILCLFLLPGSRAAFQTNLGAVSQTAMELSAYRRPEWPIQDAVRRSYQEALTPAIQRYAAAYRYNPDNAGAGRRLGQIAVSFNEIDRAQQYLERAYHAQPGDRTTRQMLGEVYALQGRTDDAVRLWTTIDVQAGQLQIRQWWWQTYGTPEQQTRFTAALTQLQAKSGP